MILEKDRSGKRVIRAQGERAKNGPRRPAAVRLGALALSLAIFAPQQTSAAVHYDPMVSVSVSCGAATMAAHGVQGSRQCAGNGNGDSRAGSYQAGTVRAAQDSDPRYAVDVQARADYGAVGAASNASLTSSDISIWAASASGGATWRDFVTLDAPNLAAGIPVALRLSQVIDIADMQAARLSGSYAQAWIVNSFQGGSFNLTACGGQFLDPSVRCNDGDLVLHTGQNMLTYDFYLPANLTSQLTSSIYVQTAAKFIPNDGASGGGSGRIDALHTAHTYLTVLTPGATLTAASGHNYALPAIGAGVPEPQTWVAMVLGFGLMGAAMRRRPMTRLRTRTC